MTNTVNIDLNGETPETIPWISGFKQGCQLYSLFSDTTFQATFLSIKQEKEINELQKRKEELKLILRDSRI